MVIHRYIKNANNKLLSLDDCIMDNVDENIMTSHRED